MTLSGFCFYYWFWVPQHHRALNPTWNIPFDTQTSFVSFEYDVLNDFWMGDWTLTFDVRSFLFFKTLKCVRNVCKIPNNYLQLSTRNQLKDLGLVDWEIWRHSIFFNPLPFHPHQNSNSRRMFLFMLSKHDGKMAEMVWAHPAWWLLYFSHFSVDGKCLRNWLEMLEWLKDKF